MRVLMIKGSNWVQGSRRNLILPRAQPADCPLGALIHPIASVDGNPNGPLKGLTWTCKDLFDVAGEPTGFGNPTWKETHPVPTKNAPAVQALLDAGANLRGKAHMDELAYSLNGENTHYGTPRNPAAPGRIPGGSSSGSASSVAGGLADFSLGSDTAGSVRIPASYCGLFGYRPTHGRISLEGARPLAPSFDTVGLFSRDASTLQRAAAALLAQSHTPPPLPLSRILIATDALALVEEPTRRAFLAALERRRDRLAAILPVSEGPVADEGVGSLEDWLVTFRVLQGREVWKCHGEFVQTKSPQFGPGINERFLMASRITEEEERQAAAKQRVVKQHVDRVMSPGTVVILPTAPGPAPILHCPQPVLEEYRRRALSLTCLAGLNGLPQVTVPGLTVAVPGSEDPRPLPVGVSVVGPRGTDEQLLQLAGRVQEALFG